MNQEMIIMNIIVNGGNARSKSMEAIQMAKKGEMEKALELIEKAKEDLGMAHEVQTKLIQSEAAGDKTEVSLLMVHAQDHLMNAMTVKDLAIEFVELYQNLKTRV
jgi:PTS system cellobiose-specific IIA component